jgi:CubicO group peptidase (beta-lactamase class C family)
MEPGQQFVYNSGITILLSHILQTSVSMPVDEYAQKHLFDPMGIQDFYWKKTPKGLTDAEGGLYLSTRDFAKIGLLYLNNGRWLDQQILPKEWVTATMTPATDTGFSGNHYGFQWWLAPYEGGKEKWMFSGSGYGGQYLLIIPEHNLVMVFNGWNIFDISRPTKEYLSSRVLKALAS